MSGCSGRRRQRRVRPMVYCTRSNCCCWLQAKFPLNTPAIDSTGRRQVSSDCASDHGHCIQQREPPGCSSTSNGQHDVAAARSSCPVLPEGYRNPAIYNVYSQRDQRPLALNRPLIHWQRCRAAICSTPRTTCRLKLISSHVQGRENLWINRPRAINHSKRWH